MGTQEDKNKQLAIDFFSKGINDQNFDVIARILSPLYTYNGDASSVAGNKEWIIGLHSQYPGLAFTFEDILAEGDKVAVRWKMAAPAAVARPAGWMTGTNIVQIADDQILSNYQNGTLSSSWTPAPTAAS